MTILKKENLENVNLEKEVWNNDNSEKDTSEKG